MSTKICGTCCQGITSGEPYLPQGTGFIHQRCFSLGTCHGCSKDLTPSQDILEAQEAKWHVKCFTCALCSSPISGGYSIRSSDKKPVIFPDCCHENKSNHLTKSQVCRPCSQGQQQKQAIRAASLGTCKACGQEIRSDQRALQFESGETFHPDCFKCSRCLGDFVGGTLITPEGKYLCQACGPLAAQERREELQRKQQQQQQQQQHAQVPGSASTIPSSPSTTICVACRQAAKQGDTFVKIFEELYHRECVRCGRCQQPIEGASFASYNNKPHCIDCTAVLRSEEAASHEAEQKRKNEQLQPTTSELLDYSGSSSADMAASGSLVSCSVCHERLSGGYLEFQGKPFCDGCAQIVQRSTSCHKCRKIIDPNVSFRKALGRFYHHDCFFCTECKAVIMTNEFKSHQGKPYCDEHYTTLFGQIKEKCLTCAKVINEGEAIEHGGKFFHSQCFVCSGCSGPFINGQFMPNQHGKLFCRSCFLKGACTK